MSSLRFIPAAAAIGLFAAMLALVELGQRLGRRRLARDGAESLVGVGALEGGIFALMGLLMAFTFSGAAQRLDTRRGLIVEEANAIGTAWLRIDLAPAGAQPALRDLFRRYVDSRLEVYRKLPDIAAARAELAANKQIQDQIWRTAVEATREGPSSATVLLLPALNAMIDITTTRTMATQMHPPLVIYATLGIVSLAGALLAGYGLAASRSHRWFHVLCFVAIMAVTIYVILNLEYPRMGFIRFDTFDQVLVELRQGMQ
jgi:hypothetical protein